MSNTHKIIKKMDVWFILIGVFDLKIKSTRRALQPE
jgi:hypothetical protein